MPRRDPLRSQLLAFTPADEAEAVHRRRMLELIEGEGDPFSRSHFVPGHFTASAFVLSPDLEGLLLIFHGKFHRWLQPGGHVDPDDRDLAAAARREVLEEAGINVQRSTSNVQRSIEPDRPAGRWTLDVERWTLNVDVVFDLDIHPIPANPRKSEPAHEHFDVRFLFQATAHEFQAGSDAKDARWVALDEVTEELTDASVVRAVRKLRSLRSSALL